MDHEKEAYLIIQYDRCWNLWKCVLEQAIRDALATPRRGVVRPWERRNHATAEWFCQYNESLIDICNALECDPFEFIKRVRGKNASIQDIYAEDEGNQAEV